MVLMVECGVVRCDVVDGLVIKRPSDLGAIGAHLQSEAADTTALPLSGNPGAVSMGNPHCVFFVEDTEAVPLAEVGPHWEHHPMFPARTNVEFAQVVSRAEVRLRVWERGAGITLVR